MCQICEVVLGECVIYFSRQASRLLGIADSGERIIRQLFIAQIIQNFENEVLRVGLDNEKLRGAVGYCIEG